MGKFPALDISHVDADFALAAIDDCSPVAVETHDSHFTIFFTTDSSRDRARDVITQTFSSAIAQPRDVDDEDWARRSQEHLGPITVGRITVTPVRNPTIGREPTIRLKPDPTTIRLKPDPTKAESSTRANDASKGIVIVIVPSMGFGTGHHATTRLCLSALQRFDPTERTVLDIGTGSGLLAIAARLLGARDVLGLDHDPDAIQSARENLDANPDVSGVRFEVIDLADGHIPSADIVTANLTGALLIRSAPLLVGAVQSGGVLIVSGLLQSEHRDVTKALRGATPVWEGVEDEWCAMAYAVPGPANPTDTMGV